MSIELLNIDCMEYMKGLDANTFDLTLTSPPYDNLRTYNDSLQWNEDIWKAIIKELYRVTKEGGVVVWVVGDATIKGSETGTSFKQALWAMECGFNLHDTMIYRKASFAPYDPKCNRYWQEYEYMFIFSKGKPKTCNYIMVDCIYAGQKKTTYQRSANGNLRLDRKEKNKNQTVKDQKIKANIWEYAPQSGKHPAPFPEQLAKDHIVSWSNEGDLVFDPFMGSGTTGKMAKLLNRRFVGTEKVKEYYDISCERIKGSGQDSLFKE